MKNVLYVLLVFLAQPINSFAQENVVSAEVEDVREQKKFGVYLGIGTPYPSLLGINVGYNISSDVRVTAGYAELEATTSLSYNSATGWQEEKVKASTFDLGAEYYFMKGQSWRPIAGVHMGYVDISGKGEMNINSFKKDTVHAYVNAGVDYVSRNGYQFAVGYNQGVVENTNGSVYVNAGQFF